LSFETWDIFEGNDVNALFSNFLNTYLRIYYSSLTENKMQCKHKDNTWITAGMKISCIDKRNLYLHSRKSNDTKLKEHYKLYCKILSKVIKAAKELHYDKIILISKNKMNCLEYC
jgi:F0F1-type ATP synthase gamma subunit